MFGQSEHVVAKIHNSSRIVTRGPPQAGFAAGPQHLVYNLRGAVHSFALLRTQVVLSLTRTQQHEDRLAKPRCGLLRHETELCPLHRQTCLCMHQTVVHPVEHVLEARPVECKDGRAIGHRKFASHGCIARVGGPMGLLSASHSRLDHLPHSVVKHADRRRPLQALCQKRSHQKRMRQLLWNPPEQHGEVRRGH